MQAESALNAYSAWYPAVQQTLLCLGRMYRCVDGRIFGGLAQEAVASATAAVQSASRLVAKRAPLHPRRVRAPMNISACQLSLQQHLYFVTCISS